MSYDSHNNLSLFKEQTGGARKNHATAFTYDAENKPLTLAYSAEGASVGGVSYSYDAIARVTGRTVTVGNASYATAYTYLPGVNGKTTGLIQSITQTGENFSYTYDDVGNISSVTQNGLITTYEYDPLGQLTRVNDRSDTTSGATGTTWTYEYDFGGNIKNKKRYAYTTGALGTALETDTYGYDTAWKDKLTSYNGASITYDEIGNPLTDGTWSYTWVNGRQLASMSKTGTMASFVYNAEGLRVQKTVNGVVTKYILHGKNITHFIRGNDELHFFYDASGAPAVVEWNNGTTTAKYAYVKNLQGDIIAILDDAGAEVVKYSSCWKYCKYIWKVYGRYFCIKKEL